MLQLFCDFDGTICEQDTLQLLLQHHASREWWILEQAWRSGRLSTRECLSAQLALLQCTPRQREQIIRGTTLTSGFKEFNLWRLQLGLPLTILSDGLEPVIQAVLQWHGIEGITVMANQVDFLRPPLQITFPHANPEHQDCAMCKGSVLRKAKRAGALRVFIGDGLSDRCAAPEADLLFAKSTLALHCKESGIAFHPWHTFEDIQRYLQKLMPDTPLPQQRELCHASR